MKVVPTIKKHLQVKTFKERQRKFSKYFKIAFSKITIGQKMVELQ
jgi:hypothetical protein